MSPALAQSTAINGTIEGTIKDEQGAVLPGVTVTVSNVDTGDQRVVVTNESGLYRAPLLSLGTYQVVVELQGFKKVERTGISLRAGQTAVIDFALTVGAVAETITVTADSPLVDLAKIEQGRTLSEAEIKTLPLTSRNPYNFALLQPGVVGFETNEFGVPRITANGALLRVNYQLDGSNNTQKDRAGLRQMPMSEVMIREVKVVTSGYAPEFGQTMGLVYNAITPSGNNTLKGQGSYRMPGWASHGSGGAMVTSTWRGSNGRPATELSSLYRTARPTPASRSTSLPTRAKPKWSPRPSMAARTHARGPASVWRTGPSHRVVCVSATRWTGTCTSWPVGRRAPSRISRAAAAQVRGARIGSPR